MTTFHIDAYTVQRDLEDRFLQKARRIATPVYTNRASSIGAACLRQLYYQRTAFDKAKPFSTHTLRIFNEGKRHERAIVSELNDAGYDWIEGQSNHVFYDLQLSCTLEGYVRKDGRAKLAEIKSMDPRVFMRMNSLEDFKQDAFARRYLYQVTTYFRASQESADFGQYDDSALLICRDRNSGDPKVFDVKYDEEIWIDVMERCRTLNKAVENKEPPERIGKVGDKTVCGYCAFEGECLPGVRNDLGGVRVLEDVPGLEEKLERRESLRQARSDFESVNDELKDLLRGVDGGIVGRFFVEGKLDKRGHWRGKVKEIPSGDKE